MSCPLLTARDYKEGFNAGLILCGFEEDRPMWLGTNKEWQQYD